MLRTNSELSVICSANPLAAGLSVLEISQSSNSTKTADKPMLAEKTHDASLCAEGFLTLCQVPLFPVPNTFLLNEGSSSCPLFLSLSLDSMGNSLRWAMTTAATQVNRNGAEDNTIVEGGTESRLRRIYAGLQSSQSEEENMARWRVGSYAVVIAWRAVNAVDDALAALNDGRKQQRWVSMWEEGNG